MSEQLPDPKAETRLSLFFEGELPEKLPLSEVARLMEKWGAEIAPKIYQDYQTKFPQVRRGKDVSSVDYKNLVVLSSMQGLFGSEEPVRVLAVYLGPELESQNPEFFNELPSIGFLYVQDNSDSWYCDSISVRVAGPPGRKLEPIQIPMVDGKVQPLPKISSRLVGMLDKRFFENQTTKMEDLERQHGKYVVTSPTNNTRELPNNPELPRG